jgi:Toprim domain
MASPPLRTRWRFASKSRATRNIWADSEATITSLGAWAAGGATRMPALADAVPDYIDFVTIVADRDPAGIRYANALADRLRKRGIEHRVAFPDGGRDA